MIPREYTENKGGIYCAIPIGVTPLDSTTVLHRMAELMLRMRVMMVPTNGTLHMEALVNDNRAQARELLVEHALEHDAGWIFWVDSDVLIPCDALVKLFSRNAGICGGLIVTKSDNPQPLILYKGMSAQPPEFKKDDLVKCDAMGFGCTLMNMDIFRKLEKPWFTEGYEALEANKSYTCTEDAHLMYRAGEAGFDCYVDTSIICKHVNWKTGAKYWWDKDRHAPIVQGPGGKQLVIYDAKQQIAYQEARDEEEEK